MNVGVYKNSGAAAAGLAYLEESGQKHGEMNYVCVYRHVMHRAWIKTKQEIRVRINKLDIKIPFVA